MEGTDCVQSYPILPNEEPTTTARCYCSRGMVNHFPLNTQNHSFTHTPTPTPVAFLSFFTRGGRRAVDGFKGDDEWWQMWLARISALSGVQWWYVVFFSCLPIVAVCKRFATHTHTHTLAQHSGRFSIICGVSWCIYADVLSPLTFGPHSYRKGGIRNLSWITIYLLSDWFAPKGNCAPSMCVCWFICLSLIKPELGLHRRRPARRR